MLQHRFRELILPLAVLALCSCDNTPRGVATKSSATVASTPMPVSAAPTLAEIPDKTWNVTEILNDASFKTVEWPAHPDWFLITLQNRDLLMHSQEINSSATTTLRFPLEPGIYRFQAVVTLDDLCLENVLVNIEAIRPESAGEQIFATRLIPGRLVPIEKTFGIDGAGRELSITIKMAPDAANIFNACTRWSVVKLDYWGSGDAESAAATSDSPSL